MLQALPKLCLINLLILFLQSPESDRLTVMLVFEILIASRFVLFSEIFVLIFLRCYLDPFAENQQFSLKSCQFWRIFCGFHFWEYIFWFPFLVFLFVSYFLLFQSLAHIRAFLKKQKRNL